MSSYDGSLRFDTSIDGSGFKSGVEHLNSVASQSMKAVSATIAGAIASIGGLGLASLKLGGDFENATAKASTLFGDVKVDVEGLDKRILELSDDTGLLSDQIGESLYNALSAGIPATEDMADAMGYMEKNAKLAKAGFTDIDTTVTATAKVLNAYKMDVSETDKVHKILMQTQNKGITTVGELGATLAQVTPTASAMNVSFEQVGASLATMTAQGTPTAQATTQLNSLFAELGKKGTSAQKGLDNATEGTKYAGKSFQDLMKEGVPLNDVLNLMSDYAKDNGKSLIDMFGSLEAGKAALAMSGENAKQFTSNLSAMSTEVDVVTDAYNKMSDTFPNNTTKLMTNLKNLGISFYDNIQVSANNSVKELSKTVTSSKFKSSFNDLSKSSAELISQMTKLAIKAIPALIKGLTFVADNFKKLVGVVGATYIGFKSFSILSTVTKSFQAMSTTVATAKLQLALFSATNTTTALATAATNGILTASEIAVGLLTGKITLATAAQAAWNMVMLANPIALFIGALGALTLGIVAYKAIAGEAKDGTALLIDETKKLTRSSQDLNVEIGNGIAQRANSIQGMENEAGAIQLLADKMFALNDKAVLTNDEKLRMVGLVDTLNEKIPELGLKIDDETGRLENQKDEVYRLIDANIAMYKVKALEKDLMENAEAQIEVDKKRVELGEQRIKVADDLSVALSAAHASTGKLGESSGLSADQQGKLWTESDRLKNILNELDVELANNAESSIELNTEMEDLFRLMGEQKSLSEIPKKIDDVSESTKKLAPAMAMTYEDYLAQTENISNATSDMATDMTEAVRPLPEDFDQTAKQATANMRDSMREGKPTITGEAISIRQDVTTELSVLPDECRQIGENMVKGIWEGMDSLRDWLTEQIQDFVDAMVKSAKEAARIHSPSKRMAEEFGKPLVQGAGVGFHSEIPNLEKAIQSDMETMFERMKMTVMAEQFRTSVAMTGVPSYTNYPMPQGASNNQKFTQIINSPKALSPSEISMETENFLYRTKWRL